MPTSLETTIKLAKSEHGGNITTQRNINMSFNTGITGTNPIFSDWSFEKQTIAAPPSRYAHYAATVGEHFFIFGGYNTVYLNDMWKLDLTTGTWSKINSTPTTPSVRASGYTFVLGKKIYIHGGFNGTVGFNDLYEFDTETQIWTLKTTTGSGNIIRWSHTGAVYAGTTNILYIASGMTTGSTRTNTTIRLNLSTFVWSTGTNLPVSVYGAEMMELNGKLYFFYGFTNGNSRSNTMYVGTINTSTFVVPSWTTFTATGTAPVARGYFAAIKYSGSLYFYGGTVSATESSTNLVIDNAFRLTITTSGVWTRFTNILGPNKRKRAEFFPGLDGLYLYGGLEEYPSTIVYGDIWKVSPVVSSIITKSEQFALTNIGANTFTYRGYTFKCFVNAGTVWISISLDRKAKKNLAIYSLRVTTV